MMKVLFGGIPRFIVLAEYVSHDHRELSRELDEAHRLIKKLGLKTLRATTPQQQEKYWDFRHDSFKILTKHTQQARTQGRGMRTAPFIDDIAVEPKYFSEYIPRLMSILDEYHLLNTLAGHLGSGNLHIIPLMDMSDKKNQEIILEISERVYQLAIEYHGTITAEHNDGIIRTPFLKDMYGEEVVALFGTIKNIFDPHNIFNPRKKVGGTKDDIRKYMSSS
jgi:FAD/FMN-containing dehydrogenase